MAAQPKESHLSVVRPVDRETGELVEVSIESLALELQNVRDERDEIMRKLKGQSLELARLRRTRDAEAEADPLWPLAARLFAYHSKASGHLRAEWTHERFWMVRKLRGKKTLEQWLEECLRAISGVLSDAWRVAQGLTMWEDVFESRKKFERALAKCPEDWSPPPGAEVLLG